eukprot:351323-Chlamydomonas_euryale.AAC.5
MRSPRHMNSSVDNRQHWQEQSTRRQQQQNQHEHIEVIQEEGESWYSQLYVRGIRDGCLIEG